MSELLKEKKKGVTVHALLGATKYLTTLTADGKETVGDEPVALGGQNKGFNPYEYLASALSMCTAATLRMYADRKGLDVGEINVSVTLDNNTVDKVATFSKEIAFENKNIEQADLVRLKAIAEACPVNKLLTNQIVITSSLV